MSVLVTGAAGFIGSHLVDRLLSAGEEVVGLDGFDGFYPRAIKEANLDRARDHDRFELIEGDIRSRDVLAALPDHVTEVIHLAARAGVRPSIAEPVLYTDVNLLGTSALLEFARVRGIRPFLFASSSSVYGNNRKTPFSEDDAVDRPISPYAATKRAGELLCHAATHLSDLSCYCLRLFTAYGPRQRPDLAIRTFARLILEGRRISRFGDGSTARDYTYIDDVVAGVVAALERVRSGGPVFEIVNLGSSEPISLSDTITAVGDAFGREPEVLEKPMQPGDVDRTFADTTKAERLLGYRPSTTFTEGMASFAEWYLNVGAAQDRVDATNKRADP